MVGLEHAEMTWLHQAIVEHLAAVEVAFVAASLGHIVAVPSVVEVAAPVAARSAVDTVEEALLAGILLIPADIGVADWISCWRSVATASFAVA